jgi:hypothetical protein
MCGKMKVHSFFVPKLKYNNQLVHQNKISSSVRDRKKNKGKKDGHLREHGATQL